MKDTWKPTSWRWMDTHFTLGSLITARCFHASRPRLPQMQGDPPRRGWKGVSSQKPRLDGCKIAGPTPHGTTARQLWPGLRRATWSRYPSPLRNNFMGSPRTSLMLKEFPTGPDIVWLPTVGISEWYGSWSCCWYSPLPQKWWGPQDNLHYSGFWNKWTATHHAWDLDCGSPSPIVSYQQQVRCTIGSYQGQPCTHYFNQLIFHQDFISQCNCVSDGLMIWSGSEQPWWTRSLI